LKGITIISMGVRCEAEVETGTGEIHRLLRGLAGCLDALDDLN
jgi:hypothetical protein